MEIKQIDHTQTIWVTALFNEYRIFYKQPSDEALAKEFIQARLDNRDSVIFVALEEGSNGPLPLGFTQLYPTYSSMRATKNWILNDLFVAPEYREQGIGEKLIRTAMQFARQQGAAFVELSTATDNFTAQRLYEQIGFKRKAPESDFYTYRIGLQD